MRPDSWVNVIIIFALGWLYADETGSGHNAGVVLSTYPFSNESKAPGDALCPSSSPVQRISYSHAEHCSMYNIIQAI